MSEDTNDQRRRSETSPNLDAPLEDDDRFLDDWSMAEDFDERSDATDVVRIHSPGNDDVHRGSWLDIDDVVETASSVILELLDEELSEVEDRELEDGTLDELQAALSPEPPTDITEEAPPPLAEITEEIEILDPEGEKQLADPFDATGIVVIDVDTGEVIDSSDVPVLETGFHLIEEDSESDEVARRKLGLRLAGLSEQIELRPPWNRLVGELRGEILAEPDVRVRAAYIFIFGQVIRALSRFASDAMPLGDVSTVAGALTRSDLLERLAARWGEPDDEFFDVLRRLERLDEHDEGSIAAIRRSAIAAERLLDGDLDSAQRLRFRELLIPPETFPALVVQAVDAHATGDRNDAVAAWERLARYAKGEMASASIAVAGWLLQGSHGFFEVANQLLDEGWNSRTLLLLMQREAVRVGDRLQEARALKRLVGLDVRLGKKLPDEGASRGRLKAETSARLVRLSVLLEGLPPAELRGTDLDSMDSYSVLTDAISLNARNAEYLRRLERAALTAGDEKMAEKALVSLGAVVTEPNVRAVIWERVADLARRQGAAEHVITDHLERSLDSAGDCLPALISMGQHLISHGRFEEMLDLRGEPDEERASDADLAWRRAELLERTGGDPADILSLYRDARDAHTSSVHLFFCVERALARLADWRGLRTLYDAASESDSELGATLETAGFGVDRYRLAVELFFEDAYGDLSEAMLRYVDRSAHAPAAEADDTQEIAIDQNVLWRVIAREIETDPGRTQGRLEVLLQRSQGETTPWRLRTLVWYAHLVDSILEQGDRALGSYREVFARAESTFLQRWAVRGLLRTGDSAWVAEKLAEGSGVDWVEDRHDDSDGDGVVFRKRLAAELMSASAEADRALDILEEIECSDPVSQAEIAERATVLALRSRRWVRAIPRMFRCYPAETRPALAEIARHLGAGFDDAGEALRYIDEAGTATPVDPYVILCELELAYRSHDWTRALNLLQSGLGTIAAGSIDFRAFLLEQAVLIAEWGARSNELSVTLLEDLWGLEATVGSSPIYASAAFLRTYARMGRRDDYEEHVEFVRTNFTPSVAEALLAEPRIYEEADDGAAAADWYEARVDTVPAPLQPYYRWMAVVNRWLFGERDRRSVQDLADATSQADPTHRVGPFLLAIAYRHADMYASCERQLTTLRSPRNSRPVQDWVLVRQLFHLAVTQNQPADALERLREDSDFGQFAWYGIAEELFARAVREPTVVDALRERANVSGGSRSLRLEIAEILQDRDAVSELAGDQLPEAVAQTEMLAASGESMPRPRWDVDARYAQTRAAVDGDDVATAGRAIYDYFVDVDEELLGTPWCPLRVVRGDLSQYDLENGQLDRLADRVASFEETEMGAEARLLVARELLRRARHEDAARQMPAESGPELVSVAWSLFNFALAIEHDAKNASIAFDLWQRRRSACGASLTAEVEYELGRCLEAMGNQDEAIGAMRRALQASPRFLPAQVTAGRLLIRSDDWRGLAALWEAEMEQTEDVESLASVAFRLGYLWERRLSHLPDARRHAQDAYRRVLRVRPNHFPTLHALLALAYERDDWGAAERHLESIVESCPDDALRVSYLCELASIRETHLEDLDGAREAYEVAFEIDRGSVEALFGVLRTDVDNEVVVDVIRRRLQHGVTQRELRDLSNHLFGTTRDDGAADDLIAESAPTHYAWLVTRLIRSAEQGDLHREAAEALVTYNDDESTRLLAESFERVLTGRRDDGPEDLVQRARSIGTHPLAEGKLVAAMHYGARRGDLEVLGTLAAVRARRSSSELLRAAELTWLAFTLMLRGEWADALGIAEQLLGQVPDFVPAIKAAKFAADVAHDWEAVVRWFQRDASLTTVDEVASADRLYASEVQRKHLGDFDAALSQLKQVLDKEPTHEQAFARLREILLTRGDYHDLLEGYEERLTHIDAVDARAELLNEMGDVALNHLHDRRAAIAYLSRSLEIKPKQLRRLRLLSELYETERRWDRAVACHRAAAELVDDPTFLRRLWQHVGHVYEKRLNNLEKARNAYARALQIDSDATEVLISLARVCERLEEYSDCIALLDKVKVISRDEKILLDARIGVARLKNKVGAPPTEIVDAIREVLLHHPGHPPSIDAAKQALARAGRPGEVGNFFQSLTHDIISMHGLRALPPAFEMARELGHDDRAFCIASIYEELDASVAPMRGGSPSRGMLDFRRVHTQQRRWPSRRLPPELTTGVLPAGLVAPFIELLRRSRAGLFEGLENLPGSDLIKKGSRLKEPKNKATQLAFEYPELLGLQLRDVHLHPEVPGGSIALFDGGVRLVLDERWLDVKDPTELVVALGIRLAAWSMGIGPWAVLNLDIQSSLFIAIVSNYVRGWSQAERSHLPYSLNYPRIQKWLERKGQKVAPYAMEISGRFGSAAIRQQFELLAEAQKRIGVLLVDDPGKALRAAGMLHAPEPGDRPAWLFVLDTPASRVRRAVGVSIETRGA